MLWIADSGKELNQYRTLLFFLLPFVAMLACCSKEKPGHLDLRLIGLEYDQSVEKSRIVGLIRNIPQEVILDTTPVCLLFSESYLKLEGYAHELLAIAMDLLESGEFASDEKWAIIIAIQNTVELDIYKYFLRNLVVSFRDGKIIGEKAFDITVQDLVLWAVDRRIIDNYGDPVIREALNILLRTRGLKRHAREAIRLILRGDLAE